MKKRSNSAPPRRSAQQTLGEWHVHGDKTSIKGTIDSGQPPGQQRGANDLKSFLEQVDRESASYSPLKAESSATDSSPLASPSLSPPPSNSGRSKTRTARNLPELENSVCVQVPGS